MPFSHHSHSGQFCRHAKGTLEEVVLEAIRQGFEMFGLTEHVPRYRTQDLYPEEEGMGLDGLAVTFDAFVDEGWRLKMKYAPQISILVGLETDYITGLDLDALEALLRKHGRKIEYIVGSVHHVSGIPIDFDVVTYQKALQSCASGDAVSTTPFLCAYFDAQYELFVRFFPEIIGHFDLCRLYTPDLSLSAPDVWKRVERNVEFAISYGALFEVNAAAFRNSWDTAYPGRDIVQLILAKGGKFALSDDSHGPYAVGLNYHRVKAYLDEMGIRDLYYLQHADEVNTRTGRAVQTVCAVNCLSHPFWARKILGAVQTV